MFIQWLLYCFGKFFFFYDEEEYKFALLQTIVPYSIQNTLVLILYEGP